MPEMKSMPDVGEDLNLRNCKIILMPNPGIMEYTTQKSLMKCIVIPC